MNQTTQFPINSCQNHRYLIDNNYNQSPLKANVKPITKFSIKENMKFWLTN